MSFEDYRRKAEQAAQNTVVTNKSPWRDDQDRTDFLKYAQREYSNYDWTVYRTGKSNKKTDPGDAGVFWTVKNQYDYNRTRREQQGLTSLNFGTPDYNPNLHTADDNEVWGDFYSKYRRLPSQQEFETNRTTYLKTKQEKATKEAFGLLGMTYKSGDSYTNSDYWRSMNLGYDQNDSVDIKREALGLPPKAYTSLYNMDDPEDVSRLKTGMMPKYIENTNKAVSELDGFKQEVMGLAAQNKIGSLKTIQDLYTQELNSGKLSHLESIQNYIDKYNSAVEKGEGATAYDTLTGKKSASLPWQHLDLQKMTGSGYAVNKDANGYLSTTWMDDLAKQAIGDEQQKYQLDAASNPWYKRMFGFLQQTDYEKQQSGSGGKPDSTTAAWHQGNASTGASIARSAADINPDLGQVLSGQDATTTLADLRSNPEKYAAAAQTAAESILKQQSPKGMLGIDLSGMLPEAQGRKQFAKSVKTLLDKGYKVTDLVPGATTFSPVTVRSGAASDDQKEKDLIGVLQGLGVVGEGVSHASDAEKLTAQAQENAKVTANDTGAMKVWDSLVSSVTPVGTGIAASAVTPALGATYWATLGYGQGAEEARLEGATPEQQKAFGAVDAAANIALGMFAIPKSLKAGASFTSLFSKELIKNGAKAAAKQLTVAGVKALLQAAEMPTQMVVQEIALNAAKKGIYQPNKAFFGEGGIVDSQSLKQTAENGVALSLLLSILGMPFNGKAKKYINEKTDAGESPSVDEAVNFLRQDAESDPAAAEAVRRVDEAASAGPKETKTDVGYREATADESARLDTSENVPHTDTSKDNITTNPDAMQAADANGRATVDSAKSTAAPKDWRIAVDENNGETYFITPDKRFMVQEENGKYVLYDRDAYTGTKESATLGAHDTLQEAQAQAQTVASGEGAGVAQGRAGAYPQGSETYWAAKGYGTDPKNLVDDLSSIKAEAAQLDTDAGRTVVSKAQRLIDEFVNISFDPADEAAMADTSRLSKEAKDKGLSKESRKVLDRVIQAYETDMPKLIEDLRGALADSKQKAKADLAALRANKNAKLDALEQRRQADVIAMRDKKNAQLEKVIDKLEQKRRDQLDMLRQAKNARAERAKTSGVLSDLRSLYNNRQDRPLQKELHAALPEFVDGLGKMNLTDKVDASKVIRFLQDAQSGMTGNPLIDGVWDDMQPAIDILTELNGKKIGEMTDAEIKDLRKAIRNIIHLNKEAYDVLADGAKVKTRAVVDELIRVNEGRKDVSPSKQSGLTAAGKPKLRSRIGDYFGVASLELHNVANWIMHSTKENTHAHKVLSTAFEHAGWKHADYKLTDQETLTNLMKGVKRDKWFKEKTEYTLPSGQRVELTLDELTAIYLNSFNPQNRASLNNQIRLRNPGKSAKETTFRLTSEDADALIEIAKNNSEVKRVGDGLRQWNDEHITTRINKTSQQRFGFDLADVEGYWPIFRDQLEMAKSFTLLGRTLETFSWFKKRTNSSLPIILRGALDSAVQMSDESAMFAAYAMPVKSMERVLRMPEVQKLLREKFGDETVRYFDKFLREAVVKQNTSEDRGGRTMLALARNSQAAILSSPKVILNQFAGIASAVAYLDPRYMVRAATMKADTAAMRKWAPMMYVRRVLGGSPEAGALMDMGIMPETGLDRVRSTATKGVQLGDTMTMDLAWNWALLQTKAKNPTLSGDALYKAAGELAQTVVGRTQPTNEVGYRSIVENTRTTAEKLMLPFTSGTNKVYNMAADAVLSYADGNMKRANSLVAGVIANTLAFGLVSATWNSLWKGQTDETFLKQFMMSSVENLVTTPYIAGFIYDSARAALGGTQYSIRVISTDTLEALVNSARKASQTWTAYTDAVAMPEMTLAERQDKQKALQAAQHKIPGALHDFAEAVAPIFSVPLMQFERDIVQPVLKKADMQAYYDYQGYFKTNSGASTDFVNAVKTGNDQHAKEALQSLVDDKGVAGVKKSWQSAKWYQALSPADKRMWDRVLQGMQKQQ